MFSLEIHYSGGKEVINVIYFDVVTIIFMTMQENVIKFVVNTAGYCGSCI